VTVIRGDSLAPAKPITMRPSPTGFEDEHSFGPLPSPEPL